MKQEVRRGRKFIEYHDPETQPEGTFTQEISGADVSYQDESGNWLAADENWATDGVDGFILKNDKLNHKIRLKGTGGRTWYPRRNVNTEYMTFGVPQYWNGKRWANFGFTGWSVEGKTITLNTRQNVTILVHNRWNGIKIDWVLANASAPTRMRYPVALTGITESEGVLYGADNTELGKLTPTTATDANGAELVCSGSFASGYVEFQADVTGAVYPVTIDPDFSTTSTAGDCTLTSTTRNDGARTFFSSTYPAHLIRFDLSSISSAATCTAATLVFTIDSVTLKSRTRSFIIYKITDANGDWIEGTGTTAATAKSGEPTRVAKFADGSGGTTTAWAGSQDLGTAGTDYVNTALANTITLDDSDSVGDTYTFTFNGDGLAVLQDWFGDVTNNGFLCMSAANIVVNLATSENATESYRPLLSVTYTAAGGFHPINMTANMQSLTGGMRG